MKDSAIIEKSDKFKYSHGFSTRLGGVSEGIYASLNLGMNRGDDKDKVIKNWDLFLDACGINNRSFVCGNQIHGNNVHIATKDDLRPAYGPGQLIDADGYVTSEKDVPLAIFTADCVPVLLEDSVNNVIGCVHSGWRSTVADIEGEAIKKMLSLGASCENIRIAIGPAIDKCCFEVGGEVIEAVINLIGFEAACNLADIKKDNVQVPLSEYFKSLNNADSFSKIDMSYKYMLDLRGVVKTRFMQLGVYEESIELVGSCTMCNPDRYYSHRYTNGSRGSLACCISM